MRRLLLFSCLFIFFSAKLFATNVVVTAPTLTVTTCSTFPTSYNPLGNIVITETANSDFSTGTGLTLILTAPANFEFQSGTGSIAASASANINSSNIAIAVTASTITITYDCGGTNKTDAITISGIYVRATAASSAVNATRTSGTGTVAGFANGTTVATLSSTVVSTPLGGLTVADFPNPVCTDAITTISLSGSTTASYQWQSSTDNVTFTNIAGATSSTYPYTPTTVTTIYFKCIITCGVNVTNSSVLTVTSVLCPCTATTINVNLSAKTDTTYTFSSSKSGNCCNGTNCIRFNVTTNPGTTQVGFNVTPSPSGAGKYQVDCGPLTSIGTPLCILGRTNFNIVYCKPGGESDNFTISASRTVGSSPDVTIRSGCAKKIAVTGMVTSSIVWSPVTYLSSPSAGHDTVTVTGPASGAPAYIDYVATGTATGCSSGSTTDTVRVYFAPALTVGITPASPVLCSAGPGSVSLTATALTGTAPYTYSWNTGATTQTISATSAGTYTVSVNDAASSCGAVTQTVTVTSVTTPTATATPSSSSICSGSTTSIALSSGTTGTTYSWTVAQSGVTGASAGSGTSIAQTLTTTGVSAGTATYTITPVANGCTGAAIVTTVTVNPIPTATASPLTSTLCSGATSSVALTSNVTGSTFAWTVTQTNVSGATAGSGTSIAQALTATSTLAGTAVYAITPTANTCPGAVVNATVTVNPTPVVTATPLSSSICSGATNSVALTSNVTGSTFAWTVTQTNVSGATAGSGTSIAQALTATSTSAGTAVYAITPTANSCPGAVVNATVTVNPTPVVTATPSTSTLCSGATSSVALTSNVTGSTFAWTVTQTNVSGATAGSGTSIAQALTATSTSAGTAVYAITPTANSCPGAVVNATVTVNPTPVVTATPSTSTICSGATSSVALTSNVTGSTFAWTVTQTNVSGATAGSGTSIAQALTATSTSAGTTVYAITPTANTCPGAVVNATVTVNPTPVVTATPSTSTLCSGATSSVALTSNVTGSTFAWTVTQTNVSGATAGSGTSIAQALTATSTSAGTAVYAITPTANTCPGAVVNATVTVNPTPVVTATPSTSTLCSGATSSVALTSNVTGSTFAWTVTQTNVSGATAGSGTSIAQALTATSTSAGTAVYAITPTANTCSGTVVNATVTVNPTPVVTATSSTSTLCSGATSSVALTSNVTGSTFAWTVTQTNVSGATAGSGTSIAQALTATSTSAGTAVYAITPTANTCPGAVVNATVTVNPTPTMTSAATATICSGGTVSIPLTSNVASTYTWIATDNTNTTGESTTSQSTGTLSNTIVNNTTSAQTVTYTVTPTSTGGTCAGTPQTVTVTVNPTPAMTSVSSATICSGGIVSIPLTSNVASTFTWIATDNTNTTGGSTTSQSTSTLSNTITNTTTSVQTISYTVTPTSTGGTCAGASQTVTVTVNPTPAMTSASSATICSGGTVNIPLTSNIASTYTWIATDNTNTTGESTTSQNTTTINDIITNSTTSVQTISYTVTPTSTGGSCAGTSQTVTVTVNPTPVATATPSAQTICSGTASSVALTSNVAGTTFTWTVTQSGVSGASGSSGTSIAQVLTATSTSAGTATYTITPTAGACPGAAINVTVTVNPKPAMTSAAAATICSGNAVSIPLTSNVASTYTWIATDNTNTTGESTTSQSTNTLSNTITNTTTSVQTVSYTVTPTSTGGICAGTPQTVTVTVNPTPTMTSAATATICSGGTVSIPLTSNVASTYTWIATDNTNTTGESTTSQSTSTLSNTITNTTTSVQTVTYTVTLTSTGGICAGTPQTVTITVNPTPAMTSAATATICSGGTVSIPLTSNVASTYTWIATDNTNTTGESTTSQSTNTLSNTIVNNTTSAQTVTYTVTPTSSGGTCAGTPQTVTVTVNPTPAMTSASSATICSGGTVSIPLTSNVASTFTWIATDNTNTTGESTTSQSTSTLSNTITNTTTSVQTISYTVTPTSTGGTCAGAPQTVIVTVNPTPAMTSASSATICSGGTVSIPLTSNVASTYTWIATDNTNTTGESISSQSTNTLSNTITNTTTSVQTVIYTVTPTSTGGICAGIPQTVTVTVNPTPTMTSASAATICSGGTVSIPLTSNVASTYTWIATDNTNTTGESTTSQSTNTLSNTIVNNTTSAQTVTYTVTPTSSGGTCAGTPQTVTVTVNPTPAMTSASSATICSGGTVSIPLTSNIASTYTWIATDNTNTTGESTTSQNTTTINDVITNNTTSVQTVTYTVTPSSSGGSCAGISQTVAITVNPTPQMTSVNNATICSGFVVSIPLTSDIASTYTWIATDNTNTTGESTTSQSTSTLSNTITNSTFVVQTVSYTVTPTSTASACIGTPQTVTVTVNPKPATPTASSNSPVCLGGTLNLSTATVTGATYSWSGPSAFTSSLQNPSIANVTAANAGTYSLTISVNGCVSSIRTISIIINPPPTAPAVSSNSPVCTGKNLNLVVTAMPAATYSWTGPNGFTSTLQNPTISNVTLAATGTYSIIATVPGCGPSSTGTVSVVINQTPAISTVTSNSAICDGSVLNLTASTIAGATYSWTGPNAFTSANQNPSISGATLAATGTYSVTATVTGCTSAIVTTSVTVNPIPVAPNAGSNSPLCVGSALNLTASTVSGATYSWTGPNSFASTTQNPGIAGATLAASGTYSVSSIAAACTSSVSTVTVIVNAVPSAPTASGNIICVGVTDTLTATAPGGSYEWYSAASGGTLLASAATYITPALSTNTSYFVQTTVSGCTSPRTTVTVTVSPVPAAPTVSGTTTICNGAATTLTATAPGGTYNWYDAATSGNLLATNASYTTPVLSATTPYYVNATIAGCAGPMTTVSVSVTPTDDPAFNYSSGTYCVTGTNPTPTITGGFTGTFSSSPAGLVFVSTSTGKINLGASALNTYAITFTTNGPCPSSSTVNVTITNAPNASFNYSTPFCQSGTNPLPTFVAGASAGVFSSSPAGLTFADPATGEIDLSVSAPGTYTVTNNIAAAGGCAAATANTSITINPKAIANAGINQTVCAGTTVTLAGILGGSATSGTWSGGTGSFSNPSNLNAVYTPAVGESSADLVLTTNDPSGPCASVTDTMTILINPIPSAPSATGTTICQSTSTTLSATAPGGTYSWYDAASGGTLLITNANYTTPTLITTTTYYVQTSMLSCMSPRTAVTVNVTPTPAAPAAPGISICNGSAGVVTATAPGGTYEWYDAASGGTLLATSASYSTPTLTANATYYVQTTISACTGPRTAVTVTVNPIPAAPTAANIFVCDGSSGIVTATAPGGTYQWYDASVGGTLLATNASYTTPALNANATYYVQTTALGCTSSRTTVNVTVNPVPVAPTAAGTTICQGTTATISATAPGGTYKWFNAPSGGTLLITNANYATPALTTNTTYYVQTTVSGCTSPRTSVTVTVTPTPATPTAASASICSGSSATLTATAPGGTYDWYDAASGGTLLIANNASYTTPTLTTTTTYYVQTTISSCASSRAAVTVTVNPIPAAPTAAGVTLCSGNSATVTATAPGGTYQWYDAVSGGTLLASGAAYTTPVLTTSDIYYVQSSSLGCTGPRTAVAVTVNPVPVTPTVSGNTICAGLSDTLIATAPGGTYQWYNSASGGTLLNTGSSYITPTLTLTTTYYVQTTVSGCTSTREGVTVTVNPIPSAPTVSGASICEGSTTTLTATAPGGAYSWYDAASGGTLLGSGASYATPALTLTTTYYINTTQLACSSAMTAVTVTVTPTDNPAFNYSSGTYCASGTNPVPSITGGYTGTFSSSPVGLTFVSTGTGEINLTASTLNTYTVTFTTNGACPSNSSTNVTVTNAFDASFSFTNPYCQSGLNPLPTFTIGASGGVFSATPAGLNFVSTSTGEVDLTTTTPGTYTVTNSITASGGCSATSATAAITINPSAIANAGASRSVCVGSTVTLAGSIGGSATSATWSGGAGSFSNPSNLNAVYTPAAGETSVLLTLTTNDPAGACTSASDTMVIKINPIPVAPTASGTTICQGTSTIVSATAPGGVYQWFTAPASGTLLATNANYTTPTLSTNATYYVQTTAAGCAGPRTAVTVTVTPSDNPTFTYSSGTYCASGTNPTPTITGASGTFSTAPAGLVFVNTSTGEVNLMASALSTYTVTYTTNGTCPTSSTATITVTNAPDASFNYSGSPYCQSGVDPLPVFNPGASSGIFSASPAGLTFVSTSTGEINLGVSTPGIYSITNDIVAAGGCSAATASTSITINPKATVNAGLDQTVCVGSTATLAGVIGGSATSATWSGGTGSFSNTTNLNAIYTPGVGETSVTLTLTTNDPAGPCVAVSDNVSITLKIDTSSFSYSSGTFCVTGTNPTPTINGGYSGTFSSSPAGLTFVSTATGEINMSASALNTYSVTFTSNGTCPNSTSTNITVTNAPSASFSYSDPFCSSATNPLPTYSPGASAGVFSATPVGLNFVSTSTGEIDLVTSTAGTYTITNNIVASGGCAAATASAPVTINPIATVNAGSDRNSCEGATVILAGSIGGSATSATWNGGTGSFSNPSSLNAVYTPGVGETSVVLTLTTNDPAGPCGSVTDNMTLTINPIPVAPAVANDTVCFNSIDTLYATAPGGTYEWYDAATGGNLLVTNSSYVTPALTGTASYYVQTTVSGCTSPRTTSVVTVNPMPIASAGIDQVVCKNNSSISLSGTITNAGGGAWASSGSGMFTPDNITLNTAYTLTSADTATGNVMFILTSTNNGVCAAVTDTMLVSFSPATIINAGTDKFICKGTTTSIMTGSVSGGSVTGQWSTLGTGTFMPNDSTLNATYNLSTADTAAGSVKLVLTSTNNGNCNAVSDTVLITITTPAFAVTGNDTTVCASTALLNLSAMVSGGSSQGVWATNGNGTFSPDSSALNPIYILGSLDTARLVLTLSPVNACLNIKDSMVVTITPKPIANAGTDLFVCSTINTATLSGAVSGGSTTGTWTTTGTGTFSPSADSLNATYTISAADTSAGSVILILTSTNNNGCSAAVDSLLLTSVFHTSASVGNDITVCASTSGITMGGIINGGNQGIWTTTGAGTFTPSTAALNATYVPDSSDINNGSVILVLTPTNGCQPKADSLLLTFDAVPIVNAGSNQFVCFTSSSTALNGSVTGGTTTGSWATLGSGTVTPNDSTLTATYTFSAADTAAGNVSLVLTSTHNNSCSAVTDTVLITISTPSVASAGNDTTVCSSVTAIALSGIINGGSMQGVWTTNGSGTFSPDSSALNAIYVPDSTDINSGSVTLTLTPVNACQITADSLIITINKTPVVNAGTDQFICATLHSATLNGVVSGVTATGAWTTLGSGNFTPSVDSLNAVYTLSTADSSAGNITLVLTSTNNGACSAVTDTLKITQIISTSAVAGNDTNICSNSGSLLLAGYINGGSQGIWTTNGDGTFTPDSLTLNASYSPGATDIANGSVLLTLTPANGCQPVSDSMRLTINAAPVVNAGSTISLCSSTLSTVLNGSVTGNSTSGQWATLGTGSFTPNDTTLTATYNLSTADSLAGSVALVLSSTHNGSCSTVTDTVLIILNSIAVTSAGNDTTICSGTSSIQLNGAISGGSPTGQWTSIGTGTFTPNDSTLNAAYIPGAGDIASGNITLVLTSTHNCANTSDSMKITFAPVAIVNAGNDTTICAGSVISLNGSVTGPGTGHWSTVGTGTFAPDDSTLNANYTPSLSDNDTLAFILTVNASSACAAVTDTMTVFRSGQTTASFFATNACLGQAVSFADSSTANGGVINSWYWNFGTGDTSTTQNPAYTYTTGGIHTVSLVVSIGGNCLDSITKTININTVPVPAFTFVANCMSDSVKFTDNSTVSPGTVNGWTWSFGDGSNSTSQNPYHLYDSVAVYNVSLTAVSDSGCTASVTQAVKINPSPLAGFNSQSNCQSLLVNFTDTSNVLLPDTISSYSWTFGDGGTSIIANPAYTYTTGSTYTVLLHVQTNNGCSDTASKIISANQPIVAQYIPAGGSYNANQDISFTNQSAGATTYSWIFGDNATSTLPDPIHGYSVPGTYTVTLVSANGLGCSDTITHEFVINSSGYTIPTGFTPNGDGLNDYFYIMGGPFAQYELRVFNEWGNQIFMSSSQADKWDGTYNGSAQPGGTYMFIFNGKKVDGQNLKLNGEINVIR